MRQTVPAWRRSIDNVCAERLWRSLQYEDIYPRVMRISRRLGSGSPGTSRSAMSVVGTGRSGIKRPQPSTTVFWDGRPDHGIREDRGDRVNPRAGHGAVEAAAHNPRLR